MEQQMQGREVTCLLTSCGRFDLLRITLDSFIHFNTYPIKEFIIYEDSGIGVNDELKKQYPFIKWIEPSERTGQIAALDTLWQSVKTPYAFTMEDDWEFLKGGFIEESMSVLENDHMILQVWLMPLEKENKHPINWPLEKLYGILKTEPGLWCGTRFNPSLKRKADYDRIGSYGQHTTFDKYRPWRSEADISKVYHKLGFKAAILPDTYITHIGNNRHVE